MPAIDTCPFRHDVRVDGSVESAACAVLIRAFDATADALVRVRSDVCIACSTVPDVPRSRANPVLASQIFQRAHQQLIELSPGPQQERFSRIKEEARFRLEQTSVLVNRQPGSLGVLTVGERRLPKSQPSGRTLTWAAGMLTAPRAVPTLAATVQNLRQAGFADLWLFAEPGTEIPAACAHLPIVRHAERQGPLRNFYLALQTLLEQQHEADCYAIFEDDISAAHGLRRWCDEQLWPGGHGIVSLYTSRVYCDERPGWQTLNLGRYRTFGSLALVLRRDMLEGFLADEQVRRSFDRSELSGDAVLGEWAQRQGLGIAYHSPSLVQHEGVITSLAGHENGRVGSAIAVERTEDIASWQRPAPRIGRVGLLGWNTRSGLGYQNRDIAVHLPVARWLAPRHPRYPSLPRPDMGGDYFAPWNQEVSTHELRQWLRGLDWLLFVELPYLPAAAQHAREMGISVACVPNWEWLTTDLDWLPYVDLMICPTRHTFRMLQQWRQNLGFAWDIVHVPWPIDPQRFTFRRRERCDRFVFINGTGGMQAQRLDGSLTSYTRKGLELVAATARLLPQAPFLLYSQEGVLPPLSSNVQVRKAPRDNRDLYKEGDVCVQPSHWEGLGLQLLECQAAGMPLVTTDAAPMNEYRPLRAVPVKDTELVFVYGDQAVDAQLVDPGDLAKVLRELHGSDLREASMQARAWIEREGAWQRVRSTMAAWLTA